MNALKMIQIVLADDQKSVRLGLRLLLEEEEAVEIVGEAYNAGGLLAVAASRSPDLVLLDWGLPGMEPKQLITALRRLSPDVLVTILSGQTGVRDAALEAGADSFVSKASPPEQLLQTVRALLCRTD